MRRLLPLSVAAVALVIFSGISLADKNDTYDMLNLFSEVFQRVRTDYVEPVKDTDLIEAAINGMLSSLDPHSSYLNEKNFKEMEIQTRGEFGGLGIEVTMENGLVKVVSPIDDTPAYKAGIHAGDYISMINETPVMGMTLSDAVDKMRGQPDTKIKLTVLREGENEPLSFTLTRAIIRIKSVRSRAEGDGIIYLRITQFNEQTIDKLKDEWNKQKKAMGGIKGIVLDLRNNPGGLLDQAVAVSDAFLDGGEIVSTRGRDPENNKRFMAHGDDMAKGVPMVVLVNNGSASASEIVAGALQDHKRAVILGVKSFGKGSVQTIMPLPGHGAMKLTTARYYTPSGHSIQAKGITPDIIVEQAKIEPIKRAMKPLFEANLPHRLRREDESSSADDSEKTAGSGKGKKEESSETADGDLPAKEDFQLSRAIDLLRSLAIYKTIN
ncbi:MAG TPA: S41 family peptidase [Rickettsiales bacterium]|nr:S41 family peptidase [Rickettsiales bacterium]